MQTCIMSGINLYHRISGSSPHSRPPAPRTDVRELERVTKKRKTQNTDNEQGTLRRFSLRVETAC